MPMPNIETQEDLDRALARLDEIWSAKPGDEHWDERCELVDVIADFEERNIVIPVPDPVDAIAFRMEHGNLRQRDLVPYIGSPSRVSEILSRKRGLSKEMIRKLHEGLGIPLASLLGVANPIPDGFTLVEWVLPQEVVASVTAGASQLGISEETWAALLLKGEVESASGGDTFNEDEPRNTPDPTNVVELRVAA